jgi:DNA-binding XRE family transcriptional regulator
MKNKRNSAKKIYEKLSPGGLFSAHLKEKFRDEKFREGYKREKHLLNVTVKLAELRRKKHMSQRDLAVRANVPQQEISNIEQGKRNITLNTLEKMAAGLDADVDIIVRPHAV